MNSLIAVIVLLSAMGCSAMALASPGNEDSPWWRKGLEYFEPSQAAKLEDAAEEHEENVGEFQEHTDELAETLSSQKSNFLAFKAAVQASAKTGSGDVHKLLNDWTEVSEEISGLNQAFNQLRGSADQYFQEASARTMQITVPGLRKETLQSIAEGRKEYEKRLRQAGARMKELTRATGEAKSLIIALEVSVSLRHVLSEATTGFDQIEQRINGVLLNLDRLTKDGKDLLSFAVI